MDREARVLDAVPDGLFIGGAWVPARSGATLDVEDPATGAVIATVADAGVDDGLAALDAAVTAADAWSATSPRERSDLLRTVYDLVQDRAEDLALLMTLEMGKPLAQARGEVAYGSDFLRWFAEEALRIDGRWTRNPAGTGQIVVSHRPVGPCYLITPWNFPLAMAARKIAPALAAGCTVVVKPAVTTPLTTLALAKVFEEAGLPAGVLNVVTTSSAAAVSEPIIADPRLRKLSFTGSTQVGRTLLAQAADNVLRTSMELGGNAPFLVFDDADLDAAVDGAMAAKFRNIGQACTAANRFLVQRGVATEFAERLAARTAALPVGRGTTDGVEIGPLIDHAAVTKVDALVRDATDRGARTITEGGPVEGPGHFYSPTVLTGIAPGSDILTEEVFGPVVAISEFDDEDEAVTAANDTEYGLVSYVYTRDLARARRMIDRLDTGMMGLNAGVISDATAPFGGVKQSGTGREGGTEGIHEYLETKYTLIAD